MKVNGQELFKTIGYAGAALLVAGYLRYSIQETLTLLNKSLMIVGGVLLLAAAAFHFRAIRAFLSRRSARLGTNTLVMTAAVLAILILLNLLVFRHDKRFDLTAEQLYSLSDQSRRIAKGLNKDVTFIRFSKESKPDLAELMAEYESLNRRVHFERVDPQEKPGIAKQYGITRMDETIAVSGPRTERLQGTGEQDITNAILKVTRDTVKTVCFVEGHGEKSISSTEADGYSAVAEELRKETYQVKEVNLVTAEGVPPDCTVLVVGGAAKPLFPQEAAMIGKYLDAGGKALVLTDPDTDSGLEQVFQAWNISAGNNTVIDASGIGRLFGTGPAVPLVVDYGEHAITQRFVRTMTFFPLARTVGIADRSKLDPQVTELLKTSAASWATAKISGPRVVFNPKQDTKGPLSLGAAADRRTGDKQARLEVIGDSDFAANRWVGLGRNGDLFFNSINWLAQDEDLISVRPKAPANRRVTMTSSQQKMLSWLSLVILPALVVAAGVAIWWKRR